MVVSFNDSRPSNSTVMTKFSLISGKIVVIAQSLRYLRSHSEPKKQTKSFLAVFNCAVTSLPVESIHPPIVLLDNEMLSNFFSH